MDTTVSSRRAIAARGSWSDLIGRRTRAWPAASLRSGAGFRAGARTLFRLPAGPGALARLRRPRAPRALATPGSSASTRQEQRLAGEDARLPKAVDSHQSFGGRVVLQRDA